MKSIKCLIVLLTAFILSWNAAAQSYVDCLYLKNGSIIKGVILEQSLSGPVKIQTKDGNVFVYPISDVLKITKEEQQSEIKSGYVQINPYSDPVPAGLLSWSWENNAPVVKADQQYVVGSDKLYDLLGETNYRMFQEGSAEYLIGDFRQSFAWWTGGATLGGLVSAVLSVEDEDGMAFLCLAVTVLAGGATLYLVLSGYNKMNHGEELMNTAIGNHNDAIKKRLSHNPVLKVQPALVYAHSKSNPAPGLSLTLSF